MAIGTFVSAEKSATQYSQAVKAEKYLSAFFIGNLYKMSADIMAWVKILMARNSTTARGSRIRLFAIKVGVTINFFA